MKKLINFGFLYAISLSVFAQSTVIDPKFIILPQYPGDLSTGTAIPVPSNGMIAFNSVKSKIMAWDFFANSWRNYISNYHIDDIPFEIARIRNDNPSATSYGLWAETQSVSGGRGIYGKVLPTGPSGDNYGVVGENLSLNALGYGVYGLHRGNGTGVKGESSLSGIGVRGHSNGGQGVWGTSGTNVGVYGQSGNIGGYFEGGNNAIITGSGSIGLGTSVAVNLNPDERVDINGRVRVRHDIESAGVWFNNAANTIGTSNGAFFGMQVATAGSEKAGIFVGGLWNLTVDRAGNTCVRGILQSNGACTPSDFRYKKDIKPLSNSLQNLLKIDGVSYVYKNSEFPDKQFSDKNQIGFIAQDIEKIYPEMVFTDENGYKSVDYAKLTPVLVEALKEQQREIENLKRMVVSSNSDIQAIKNMLQAQNGK